MNYFKQFISSMKSRGHGSKEFYVRKVSLLGNQLTLQTARQDRVLSSMFRGEVEMCPYYLAELQWLADQLTEDTIMFEAGGNVGSVAIALALENPSARIISFEPDPLNYSLFQINLRLNGVGNVEAFNMALGKKAGLVQMYTSPDNFGDHRTSKPLGFSLKEDSFIHASNMIPMVQGRDFLHELGLSQALNLVKIDTQGADVEILRSLIDCLDSKAKVGLEFSPYHLNANGTTPDDVEEVLSRFQQIQIIEPDRTSGYCLRDCSLPDLVEFYGKNCDMYQGYFDLVLSAPVLSI